MNIQALILITGILVIAIVSDIYDIYWHKDLQKEEESKRIHNWY